MQRNYKNEKKIGDTLYQVSIICVCVYIIIKKLYYQQLVFIFLPTISMNSGGEGGDSMTMEMVMTTMSVVMMDRWRVYEMMMMMMMARADGNECPTGQVWWDP